MSPHLRGRQVVGVIAAAAVVLSLATSVLAAKPTTSTAEVDIFFKSPLKEAVLVINGSSNIVVVNGTTKDTMKIKAKKGVTPTKLMGVNAPFGLKKLETDVAIKEVSTKLGDTITNGIVSVTAKKTYVNSIAAGAVKNVKIDSQVILPGPMDASNSPKVDIKTVAAGATANIKITGAILANLSSAQQPVKLVSVGAKKVKSNVFAGGIDANEIMAPQIDKIETKFGGIKANKIDAQTGKKTMILTNGGTLGGIPSPAHVQVGTIVSGAESLTVDAKGGNVNAEGQTFIIGQQTIKKVSSKGKVVKESQGGVSVKFLMGGLVGMPTTDTATLFGDNPMGLTLHSGGATESWYTPAASAAAAAKTADITLVNGDAGVFAGMYADVNATGNAQGVIKTVQAKTKAPKNVTIPSPVPYGTVAGFGVSSKDIKVKGADITAFQEVIK